MLMLRRNSAREDEEVPVTVTIEYVPDHVVERLCERAGRSDRSLHGELPALVEEAVRDDGSHRVDVVRADR